MPASRTSRRVAWPPVLALGLVATVLHLLTAGRYGYFRDELYYIACSRHLAAGYVDHAPLSIWLLAAQQWLLGDSLHALRLLPALATGALVAFTGVLAAALGAGAFGQALAALSVLVAPVYLALGNFYSMNAFEPLFWTAATYCLIRIVQSGDARYWLLFGLVAGLGIENKHSMLFYGAGVVAGLLLTPQRRHLRSPWLWGGAALAAALALPNLIWEAMHQWPTLEFLRNAQAYKNAVLSPGAFLAEEVLMLHPLTLPVWGAGLLYLLAAPAGRPYRLLGWTFLAMLALFLLANSKPYYLAPAYPALLAAGAIAVETITSARRWMRPALVSVLMLGGVATAPMALPVLPPAALVRYASALHLDARAKQATAERITLGALPQYFADMFGWDELVATVAQAYDALPPPERARCAIFARNYGEAGAIDLLGRRYGLPAAISTHNNYWLWGPRGYDGDVVIVLGGTAAELTRHFGSVSQVGVSRCRYCMPFENNLPIFLCRQPRVSIEQLWPRLKRYI